MKIVVLDTETTGFNYEIKPVSEIIQLSYVVYDDKKIVYEHNNYYSTRNPLQPEAMSINHITEFDLENKVFLDQSGDLEKLKQFINDGYIPTGFNVRFDLNMLGIYDTFFRDLISEHKYYCVMKIFKHLNPNLPKYNQIFLYYYFKLYLDKEKLNFHDSKDDIKACYKLFKKALESITDINDLKLYSTTPVLLETLNFGKYKNQKIIDIVANDKKYAVWLLNDITLNKTPAEQQHNEDLIYTLKTLI